MKTIISILAVTALGLMAIGCGNKTAPANNTSKPANTSNSNTNATNTAATTKKSDKPALSDEKKPEGKSKSAKEVKVPDDWVYVYDENKGYGFSVPAGSNGGSDSAGGVDVFVATTPAPSEVVVYVLAYKNKKLTKEDLLNDAVKFLEGLEQTVTAGKLSAESSNYSLAEATMTGKDGSKSKAKILVGTDITDNYVMIVGTDESKFASNEKIIDEIWGSFEIWSGGASTDEDDAK